MTHPPGATKIFWQCSKRCSSCMEMRGRIFQLVTHYLRSSFKQIKKIPWKNLLYFFDKLVKNLFLNVVKSNEIFRRALLRAKCWLQAGILSMLLQHNFISKKKTTKEHQKERDRLPVLLHNTHYDISQKPGSQYFNTLILH